MHRPTSQALQHRIASRGLAPLATLLLALTLLACSGDPEGDPTPTVTPSVIATAEPTVVATPPPTATATPTPTPEPTPTAVPAIEPDATASRASYLWSGSVANPGIPWTSARITVGADPLTDPWAFSFGALAPTGFQCFPTPTDAGVTLTGCGRNFSADVDFATNEMTVVFNEPTSFGARSIETVLRPLWQRDEPPASDNVELLWQHNATDASGSYTDVWAADGIVYAPHFGGTIELLEATSGNRLGLIAASSSVLDVKVRDGILYAATTASGILIYDVSAPTAPFFLGQYAISVGANVDLFLNIHNVYLSPTRDLVFAINDTHPQTDMRIIDVSDPTAPFEAGRFVVTEARSTLEGAHDVHVVTQGGRQIAFLNALANGFFVLDVTDPANIEVLSQTIAEDQAFSHSGWITELRGRPLYLHGDEGANTLLRIYDVANLEAPTFLAETQTRPGTSIHNIEAADSFAVVSYYVDGLRVFDIRDPASPREVAHFDTVPPDDERDILQGAWGIHIDPTTDETDGNAVVVYISDRETGIHALRITLD